MSLTVVMLNWRRPALVKNLMNRYLAMSCVAGGVVVDCSGSSDRWRPDLTYVRVVPDPGLVARFAGAALARTKMVMLADDDIEVPEATVQALLDDVMQKPRGAYGLIGRNPDAAGNYNLEKVYDRCEVLLTRCLVTSRAMCGLAADFVHDMVRDLGGVPYGNGEDIVLSAVVNKMGYGCVACQEPYTDLPEAVDQDSISVRNKDHLKHRSAVVRWCRWRFRLTSSE